jgi:signal transduction histidine kinase
MRWSPDTRRLALVGTAVFVVVIGIVAERQRYGWAETSDWVPDLVIGWTLAGLGLAAYAQGRPRGAAWLLTLSGCMWFIGNFYAVDPPWLGSTADNLSWIFIAPLVHLCLAYSTGRPQSYLSASGVVAAWLLAIAPRIDWSDETRRAVALLALTGVGVLVRLLAPPRRRRDASWGLTAMVGLSGWTLVVPRLGDIGGAGTETLALDLGVVLVSAWLYLGLPSTAVLTERVIALDESTGTVREALAELYGDPSLEVGYATADGSRFVDDAGLSFSHSRPNLVTTEMTSDAGVVGIVVHQPATLTREDERKAVAVAVALAAERSRLTALRKKQAEDIAASTLRLIRTEDDARASISSRLQAGPGAAVVECARLVEAAQGSGAGDPELDAALARIAAQLERTSAELDSFAGGMGVPALDGGLQTALSDLVDGLPFAVDARVHEVECTPDIAATIWFLCAEGIANVLKHADASRLLLELVETPAGIRITIEDDGRGGADPTGSGIAGLRDRIAAQHGRCDVEDVAGGGTRLVAELGTGLGA